LSPERPPSAVPSKEKSRPKGKLASLVGGLILAALGLAF
jgi:hypothetical protein